jgi:hypothetical protein
VNTTGKVAPILAAVATVLWVVILVAYFSTGPDEGVNIGAAALALLAVPLSIAASVMRLAPQPHDVTASQPVNRTGGRVAAVLAVASIVCLALPIVAGPMVETEAMAAVARVVLLAGIVSFVASSALFALPRAG